MSILVPMFVFAFGLIVGSFLNVLALRFHSGASIVSGFSHCFFCKKRLSSIELIPVFSFIVQKGRCRECGGRISWQYPTVEAITGIVFLTTFLRLYIGADAFAWLGYGYAISIPSAWVILTIGMYVHIIAALGFWSALIAISIYDARHKIIPDAFAFIALLFALVFSLTSGRDLRIDFLSGFLVALFFFLFWAVSRGKWMGLGDAKLAFSIGIFLSFPPVLVAIFAAFWIGAIWGIAFLLTGTYHRRSQIPFGPFLVAGAFVAFLFGEVLLAWYAPFVGLPLW